MSSSRHRLTLHERRRAVDPLPLPELFDHYYHYHRAHGHTLNAIKRHQATHKLLLSFLAQAELPASTHSLTSQTMQAFSVYLQQTPVKPRRGDTRRSIFGVHAHLRDLRALCRWAHQEGYLADTVTIPLPRLPDKQFPILSTEELERVWTSRYLTGNSPMAIRNRALLGLMLDTGLRRAEVANLTLKDVDLYNCQLSVTGKGGKDRRVPFATSVRTLLEAWLMIRGPEDGTLFWLKSQTIKTLFSRIRDEVGLERFHPHQLRHQAATMLVRNHADLETVARILGHSELETTRKYLSLSDEDLRAKHAAASPFDTLMAQRQPPALKPPTRKRLSLKES